VLRCWCFFLPRWCFLSNISHLGDRPTSELTNRMNLLFLGCLSEKVRREKWGKICEIFCAFLKNLEFMFFDRIYMWWDLVEKYQGMAEKNEKFVKCNENLL
jgi:hypothetical protein